MLLLYFLLPNVVLCSLMLTLISCSVKSMYMHFRVFLVVTLHWYTRNVFLQFLWTGYSVLSLHLHVFLSLLSWLELLWLIILVENCWLFFQCLGCSLLLHCFDWTIYVEFLVFWKCLSICTIAISIIWCYRGIATCFCFWGRVGKKFELFSWNFSAAGLNLCS